MEYMVEMVVEKLYNRGRMKDEGEEIGYCCFTPDEERGSWEER
ncbi:MAG: hypothetical protein ACLFSM_05415 [Thermoplasmata archaeon]